MATDCPTSCRAIMIQPTLMPLASSKTPTTMLMVLLTAKKMETVLNQPIPIRMVMVCATVQTQLTQFVLLVLMLSRLILLGTPILMETESQTRSTHLRTVFLLWKKIWTMMETDLKTSTKPIRALTTVRLTREPTRSTLIRTTMESVMDQTMSMTRKATSFALRVLMRHRLAKKPQAWCTDSITANFQVSCHRINYQALLGKLLRTFLWD